MVRGDPERVLRAVSNVLENARKWSPPGGEVVVQLSAGELEVRDHGPGFSDPDLPHVFDRFYRSPDARGTPQVQRARDRAPGGRGERRRRQRRECAGRRRDRADPVRAGRRLSRLLRAWPRGPGTMRPQPEPGRPSA